MSRKQIRSYGLTHPGRVRAQNQDGLYLDDAAGLWLVTDGMGGHNGGEIASAIACDMIPDLLNDHFELNDALQVVHRAILQRSVSEPELAGLGTTAVLVQESAEGYEIAWAGDSRAYLWREGRLEQLTRDHSMVQNMISSGQLSQQQAENHAMKHVISSCLGTTSGVGLEVGLLHFNWLRGDRLLLCSDGLTDLVKDDDIKQILSVNADSADASQALIEAALQGGGSDNVTVVIIDAPKQIAKHRSKLYVQLVLPLFYGATVAMAFLLFLKLALPQN